MLLNFCFNFLCTYISYISLQYVMMQWYIIYCPVIYTQFCLYFLLKNTIHVTISLLTFYEFFFFTFYCIQLHRYVKSWLKKIVLKNLEKIYMEALMVECALAFFSFPFLSFLASFLAMISVRSFIGHHSNSVIFFIHIYS